MAVLKGTDLFLSVGANQIGFAQTCTVSMSTELIEQNTKSNTDNFTVRRAGRKSVTISSNGLYDPEDTAQGALITAAFAESSEVTASWGVADGSDEAATNPRFTGSFILTSLEMNATENEDATFTATLESTGTVTLDTTAA